MIKRVMLICSMDTSTLLGSIGWVSTADTSARSAALSFAESAAPAQPGHAETLLARLTDILAFGDYRIGDVDLLVFGRGPGTFTGLRIGLSTVKGIALAGMIPIIGISSLEALALSVHGNSLVATFIDARRRELFSALYEVTHDNGWPSARPLLAERVGGAAQSVAEIKEKIGSSRVIVAGNGIGPYQREIQDGLGAGAVILPQQRWAPSAFWMARVGLERFCKHGQDNLDTTEPVYLREPDARLPGTPQAKS
ncbi:MAG: tRNA (adenosine(37)-N6)-threonylcarbamoyltransferase complex dimerization subunit type 1 TsaB [Deltaproteobacteria bacterium]|nr:tRNA (adenosine(37)-N6)-threonylcarbamoyltransferase complex dimerization subunit type 1 TsaB [Deltaproteobacteria bacterium]